MRPAVAGSRRDDDRCRWLGGGGDRGAALSAAADSPDARSPKVDSGALAIGSTELAAADTGVTSARSETASAVEPRHDPK